MPALSAPGRPAAAAAQTQEASAAKRAPNTDGKTELPEAVCWLSSWKRSYMQRGSTCFPADKCCFPPTLRARKSSHMQPQLRSAPWLERHARSSNVGRKRNPGFGRDLLGISLRCILLGGLGPHSLKRWLGSWGVTELEHSWFWRLKPSNDHGSQQENPGS